MHCVRRSELKEHLYGSNLVRGLQLMTESVLKYKLKSLYWR
jgi:hypothetical protein